MFQAIGPCKKKDPRPYVSSMVSLLIQFFQIVRNRARVLACLGPYGDLLLFP